MSGLAPGGGATLRTQHAMSGGVYVRHGSSAGVSYSAVPAPSNNNTARPQPLGQSLSRSRRGRSAVVRCEARSSNGEKETQKNEARSGVPPVPASLMERAMREVGVPGRKFLRSEERAPQSQLSANDSPQNSAPLRDPGESTQEPVEFLEGEYDVPASEEAHMLRTKSSAANGAVPAGRLVKKLDEDRVPPFESVANTTTSPPSPPPSISAELPDPQKLDVENLDVQALLRTVAQLDAQETAAREQTREVLNLLRATARAMGGEAESQGALNLAKTRNVNSQQTNDDVLTTPGLAHVDDSHQVVQHPGAVCTTSWHVDRHEESNSATVTLQTTCKGSGDASSTYMEMADYAALASRALVDRALIVSRETAKEVRGVDQENADVHGAIHDILQHGKVVYARPNDVVSKFGHPSYLVRLQHPKTLQELDAIFKPRVEGDGDGWHRASIEWVAYELNRMLGMDYVPPVAYRTGGVDVDYQHFEEGAFTLFVNQVKELRDAPSGTRGVPLSRLLSDCRILDVLLHNSDRHHGHFLHGEHWALRDADGQPLMRPVLIDHAAGFRPEAFVSMEHENAFQTGPVKTVPARTYLRLRFLDAKQVAQKFGGVLSEQEMRGLLHRRNVVLDYLDKLVEQHGYSATITDM